MWTEYTVKLAISTSSDIHKQHEEGMIFVNCVASIFQTVYWLTLNLHDLQNQNLIHAVCCSSESEGIS
jgi:hypothetical protein